MGVNWSPAEPAQRCADWLIGNYHRKLNELGVKVVCRFRDDLPQEAGREKWADTVKVSGLAAYEAGYREVEEDEDGEAVEDGFESGAPYFILWFALPVWERLSDLERLALVDQRLCACSAGRQEKSGAVILKREKPDVEVWFENTERFGRWFEGAERTLEVLRDGGQVGLPLELGPLAAKVSAEQAAAVVRGDAVVMGMGSLEPADLDTGARGIPLSVLVDGPEPGDGEGAQGDGEGAQGEAQGALPETNGVSYPSGGGEPSRLVDGGAAPYELPQEVYDATQANLREGVELKCGHWVDGSEWAAGQDCPECEALARLRGSESPAEKRKRGRPRKDQSSAAGASGA